MFFKTVLGFAAPLVWASSDLDGYCDPGDAVSLLQTHRNKVMLQDQAQATVELEQDELSSLKAPPEGGVFSAFFNNYTEGPVVQKWLQYFPAYRRHLGKFLGRRELHVLQVGAAGGGSLEMWRRVFGPDAHVYGVDLDPNCKKYEDRRTKIFIGDQRNQSFWEDLIKQVPRIDILIDAGGHLVEQQIATLGVMLPHLSADGIYITENVNGFDNPFWKTLEFERLSSPQGQQYTGLGSLISSVHVYPYLLVIEMQKKAALFLPVCGHSAAWSQLHACPGNTTADDILAGIDLTGKRAVVTGGDSGLGYAIALAFARRGATVVIGTRDQNKGEAAARGIAGLTGVDVSAPWLLDLSSLSTVRSFVASFLGKFGSKLNFLINNAGIVSPSVIHHDGFELVFQVDYLGHFLLTELLLPALRNSTPSRIVNVASESHANACGLAGWPEGCFKDWTYLPPPAIPRKPVFVHYPPEGPGWITSSSYGLAKFLQIQHSEELARREAKNGVKVFSVTPSLTWTSMTYWMKNQPWLRPWCRIHQEHPASSLPTQACPFGAGEGAAVIAFCSTGDAKSGSYYSRGHACEERPVFDHGMTADMRSELYSKSLEWVGLKIQLAPCLPLVALEQREDLGRWKCRAICRGPITEGLALSAGCPGGLLCRCALECSG